jgi:hypothetical protein
MTGSRAVESVPPPDSGIRSAIRMAHRWITAAKRPHIIQPIR